MGIDPLGVHSDEELLKHAQRILDAPAASGWPLDAQGTYVAFILMGLTSRLQPVHVHDPDSRNRIMKLAQEIAADAVAADEARHARAR